MRTARPVLTTQLYGGQDGYTLHPDHTAYRPNVQMESTPIKDVLEIVALATLLGLLAYILAIGVMLL